MLWPKAPFLSHSRVRLLPHLLYYGKGMIKLLLIVLAERSAESISLSYVMNLIQDAWIIILKFQGLITGPPAQFEKSVDSARTWCHKMNFPIHKLPQVVI